MNRQFKRFVYKQAVYNINQTACDAVVRQIPLLWMEIEKHIGKYPKFLSSLSPLEIPPDAPSTAKLMYKAAKACGVGPMAGVAGTFAHQSVINSGLAESEEVIVENGGDIYLRITAPLVLGVYAGKSAIGGKIAFEILPEETPLAICSSSGKMGHSTSFGNCDLACVVSKDTALADCAATAAANMVKNEKDISRALDWAMGIPAVRGVMIILDDKIGTAGRLPRIVSAENADIVKNISLHPGFVRDGIL